MDSNADENSTFDIILRQHHLQLPLFTAICHCPFWLYTVLLWNWLMYYVELWTDHSKDTTCFGINMYMIRNGSVVASYTEPENKSSRDFHSHHIIISTFKATPYSPAYLRPLPPLAKLPTSTAIAPELTPSIFALHIPSYPIASKSYSRQNHRTCPTTHPDTSQSATLLRARALSFLRSSLLRRTIGLVKQRKLLHRFNPASNNAHCYIASSHISLIYIASSHISLINCIRLSSLWTTSIISYE